MTNTNELYQQYKDILQKAADLNNAAAVLGWDQEVYMPPKGADARARQLATLATQAHELLTSEALEGLLRELKGRRDMGDSEAANVRRSYEDFEKNSKLPAAFVDDLSRQTSESFNKWIEARQKNDYSIFAPALAKMIALKRRQAELYGFEQHPYDALLDDYEKGANVAMLDNIFAGVRKDMPVILDKIKASEQVSNECFHSHFRKEIQWQFSMEVLRSMGYDFEAGRQDYAEHPFTTSFAPQDVRITTRVDEDNFASMLWSSIHEGGHGLYEQGLPAGEYGLPLGAAASLSIHESQSRFWENCIGRGAGFWQFFYPRLQQLFPAQLQQVTMRDFYKAMNKVQPSLIRTEADEVTYHFHVMIRYEIEKALIEGSLEPKDLQSAWNDRYEQYLGIRPADDKTGVLQDVHWSHGMFGYFPTYTLGSFYAAQLYATAQQDMPELNGQVATGAFGELLGWLRAQVHQHGRRYDSEELCERITGQKLDVTFFLRYVTAKYADVYGFNV